VSLLAKPKVQFVPESEEQEAAVKAIQENNVVFLIGEAGTGKTHVAVSMAMEMLQSNKIDKIIVCRPAIESGEKIGFLPGTWEEKVEPYMVPVQSLIKEFEMCGDPMKAKAMRDNVIQQVAIAHMRGRTFNNSVVILDEAQNTTKLQMKMILTRLGKGSKIIVTGDMTQCDLPYRMESGLIDAVARLQSLEGVAVVKFTSAVSNHRHPLVPDIIEAYE